MKKTNRFIALLTALVLVFSTMINSVAFAAVNPDVVGTDFEVAVGKLKAVGVMEGYPDGTFKPEGEITRAEFAKIAVVAMGLGNAAEASKGVTKFGDVTASHWASGYINLAVNRGLVAGYPDGTYKPEGKLTNAEAITILCRMIGLGPVIDKEGTWPANYVGRATNEGLLKGVNVASGTNALRGLTAKMLVNTLTADMWGATTYKTDGTVEYGKTGETLLADKLNVTEYNKDVKDADGVKIYDEVRVTAYDTEENELTLAETTGNIDTFEVAEGVDVDLYDVYLNEVNAWVNDDDEIIFAEIVSKSFIDAIEVDGDEIALVGADKSYDIDDVTDDMYVNDDFGGANDTFANLDGNTYPLAKVVLNSKGDVVYVDAYTLTDLQVVESVKDGVITAIDGDELDLEVADKEYTIFKAGKLIDAADIVKGDILTFNNATKFAEVYNKSVAGPITERFDGTIEVKGEEYAFDASDISDIMYLNEDDEFVALDNDAAEQFEDGGDVTLFLDRAGEAIYITGDLGEVATNTVAGVLAAVAAFDASFGKAYIDFTYISEEGKKVTKTIKCDDLEKVDGVDVEDDVFTYDDVANEIDASIQGASFFTAAMWARGAIVEFVYDTDGNIVELNFLDSDTLDTALETDDKYADLTADAKLLSDTLVFVVDAAVLAGADDITADDVTIYKWSDIKTFNEIATGATVYSNDDLEALYILADTDDVDTDDTTDVIGLLKSYLTNTDGDVTRLTAWVNGEEKTYSVDKVDDSGLANGALTNAFVYTFTVNNQTGKVTAIPVADEIDTTVTVEIDQALVNVSERTFRLEGGGIDLKLVSDAVILDLTGGINDVEVATVRDLRDTLLEDNNVVVVMEESSTKFVKMVVITSYN